MSYTHYMAYRPQDPAWAATWPQLCSDAQQLVTFVRETEGIDIAGPMGDGEPIIGPDHIALNGRGDDACETLYIAGPTDADEALGESGDDYVFGHPRTNMNSYDSLVGAILMRAAQLCPQGFVFGSEGTWDSEWLFGASIGASSRDLGVTLFGTDHMPPASVDYFVDDVEPEDIFAALRRAALFRDAPEVIVSPLSDAIFRDGTGLGL